MSAAYRDKLRSKRVVLHAPARTRRVLLVLAVLSFAIGATFSTVGRLTVTCWRGSEKEQVTYCEAFQAEGPRRWSDRLRVAGRPAIAVEGQRVMVDGRVFFEADLSPSTLEHAYWPVEAVTRGLEARTTSHEGGWSTDHRVVLTGFAVGLLLVLGALRRHRVVIDPDGEQIVASTTTAFLPWTHLRTSVRRDDRVQVERGETRARIVLVGDRGRRVLVEDEAGGEALERLAARIDREIRS